MYFGHDQKTYHINKGYIYSPVFPVAITPIMMIGKAAVPTPLLWQF